MAIYTIGFTKKTAEIFFETLKSNNIDVILDIRLNNTSQLASFAKYPDIKYFLDKLVSCDYIHDVNFAPEEKTLKDYKTKQINWNEYVEQFNKTMHDRNIRDYIVDKHTGLKNKNVCLLCSEAKHHECHRSLVSQYFKDIFNVDVVNL